MFKKQFSDIRDLINHPWKREILYSNTHNWDKICSSMDTIEDSQEAIDSYKSLNDFNADGNGHLYVYGLLQAIYLQQDAIRHFNEVIGIDLNLKKEYPELFEIREIRNNSIGHPSNRGNGKSFHHIGRFSIRKQGFIMLSYFPKSDKKDNVLEVDLIECIEKQEELTIRILDLTKSKLIQEMEEHKERFNGDKLEDKIHPSIDYQFEKLYKHAFSEYEGVNLNFESIIKMFEAVKDGITNRYSIIRALENVEILIERIDYVKNRLNRDLINDKIEDSIELEIMIQAFERYMSELKKIASSIDLDFS